MSDDLAEAVERLRRYLDIGGTYEGDWEELDDEETYEERADWHRNFAANDLWEIATHYLSTLTAPTPVTVEGLKELGFEEDYAGAYVFRQGDESIMCRPIGYDLKYPVWYLTGNVLTPGHKPQNMNDVKCLVSRLSRPKQQ